MRCARALAVLVVLAVSPAMAEQVLYLANGSKMPIRDHVVREDMIHVDLGDGASMAFPLSQVEKVVAGGRDITFFREGDPANRQVGPRPDGVYTVGGRSAKSTMEKWAEQDGAGENPEDSKVERDPTTGMSVYRPFKDSPSRARRELALTGNQAVLGGKRAEALGRGEKTPKTKGATTKSAATVSRKSRQPFQKEWGPPPAPPPVEGADGEAGGEAQEAGGEE